jgi:hypothetical protein
VALEGYLIVLRTVHLIKIIHSLKTLKNPSKYQNSIWKDYFQVEWALWYSWRLYEQFLHQRNFPRKLLGKARENGGNTLWELLS